MLCVTGMETTAQQWRARVTRSVELLRATMHELRLDAMHDARAALTSLGQLPANTVVCCRPVRQGGQSLATDAARLAMLKMALAQGARWIDVEADLDAALLDSLPRERVILSWHDYRHGDAATIRSALTRAKGRTAAYKIAISVSDASQLHALLDVAPSAASAAAPTAVLLAMGPAGLLSRMRYHHFGSAWTYVAASDTQATAPGQLSLASAHALGVLRRCRVPLLALLGGPQVMHSPGPRVYGRLLANYQYLPVVTGQLHRSLSLLRRLGGVGASVTMPLKQCALRVASVTPLARQVGAANTLVWRRDGWHADNSDVAGVAHPLRHLGATRDVPLSSALILGAGGAAAAAVVALRQLDLHITIAARNREKARPLGADRVVAFGQRHQICHDLLVNATPIGGDSSPWQQKVRARVVFDMSLAAPSRLLQQGRAAGAQLIDGAQMWCAQGAVQMVQLTGVKFDAAQLREALV